MQLLRLPARVLRATAASAFAAGVLLGGLVAALCLLAIPGQSLD